MSGAREEKRGGGGWRAAFLLVIPGATLAGFGIGVLQGNPFAWIAIGAGAGAVLWGTIVGIGGGWTASRGCGSTTPSP